MTSKNAYLCGIFVSCGGDTPLRKEQQIVSEPRGSALGLTNEEEKKLSKTNQQQQQQRTHENEKPALYAHEIRAGFELLRVCRKHQQPVSGATGPAVRPVARRWHRWAALSFRSAAVVGSSATRRETTPRKETIIAGAECRARKSVKRKKQ